jgi:hypothetical protein
MFKYPCKRDQGHGWEQEVSAQGLPVLPGPMRPAGNPHWRGIKPCKDVTDGKEQGDRKGREVPAEFSFRGQRSHLQPQSFQGLIEAIRKRERLPLCSSSGPPSIFTGGHPPSVVSRQRTLNFVAEVPLADITNRAGTTRNVSISARSGKERTPISFWHVVRHTTGTAFRIVFVVRAASGTCRRFAKSKAATLPPAGGQSEIN